MHQNNFFTETKFSFTGDKPVVEKFFTYYSLYSRNVSLNCFGQWISINEPKYSAKAQFFSFSLNSFVLHNILACASLFKSFSSCLLALRCLHVDVLLKNDKMTRYTHLKCLITMSLRYLPVADGHSLAFCHFERKVGQISCTVDVCYVGPHVLDRQGHDWRVWKCQVIV